MKMEMLVSYNITLRHNPGDLDMNLNRCENLKSRIMKIVVLYGSETCLSV
jgi:hypothetical protein